MGTLIEAGKFGIGWTLGTSIGGLVVGPSQDAKLQSKDRAIEREYNRQRHSELDAIAKRRHEENLAFQSRENFEQRRFEEDQNREERISQQRIQEGINETNIRIAELDYTAKKYAAEQAREAVEATNQTRREIAAADFEIRNRHHEERLRHEEEIVSRQLAVQMNIAQRTRELETYLTAQKLNSDREIARFNALATRETQILISRENAINTMRDTFVQEAIKNFPLNVSPIVLLRNRPHSLNNLLAFTEGTSQDISIEEVYEEVKNYALSPEALNIFIAPIHIDSQADGNNVFKSLLWDAVFQQLESFFDELYNRNSTSPVILYHSAWKKDFVSGAHTSETLYYFLKDMPCFVLEPRFDGRTLTIVVSAWGLGYETSEHNRSEIKFEMNVDLLIAEAVYTRSKRSMKVISNLGDKLTEHLKDLKLQLQQNISYFEALNLNDDDKQIIEDINSIGIENLFHIEPAQDLQPIAQKIASHLSMILSILTDIHHLKSTDANIKFPGIFKTRFPDLFELKDMRKQVFRWYENVYIRLRNQEKIFLPEDQSKIMTQLRETQIRNLAFTLELVDESTFLNEVDQAIMDFAKTKHNFESNDMEEVWWRCIDNMTEDDVPFFEELKEKLPRKNVYRRRILNRLSDLKS